MYGHDELKASCEWQVEELDRLADAIRSGSDTYLCDGDEEVEVNEFFLEITGEYGGDMELLITTGGPHIDLGLEPGDTVGILSGYAAGIEDVHLVVPKNVSQVLYSYFNEYLYQ